MEKKARAVLPGKEWRMNQIGYRLIKRKCVKCGKEIRVKQIYNTHYSDWEDIEPWMCKKCQERNDNNDGE